MDGPVDESEMEKRKISWEPSPHSLAKIDGDQQSFANGGIRLGKCKSTQHNKAIRFSTTVKAFNAKLRISNRFHKNRWGSDEKINKK